MLNLKKGFALLMSGVLAMSLMACGNDAEVGNAAGGSSDTVVVSGKNFTEQDILVHIMSSLIEEKTDLTVERKPFLGGSQLVHSAILKGDVDIYPEYTGTAWISILKQEDNPDPKQTYDQTKAAYEEQFELTWLEPLGFNNTYTLSMRTEQAEELDIETISDLAKHSSKLTLGATQEFLERPDGYKGLQEIYPGLKFESTKGLDPGLTYGAVKDGAVDVNDAFSTDGRIPAFNLKSLKDDKNFFPPYYAAPVVRMDTLEAHPELKDVLNLLAGKLDEATMAQLNAKVDLEGQNAQDVAEAWLKEQGLME
ncbi:glycine betaine ABC transporter substrate-binding protein [Ammoniphilus sp. 3BR4]|uniref:glycine betaine ABC transporter substrate-binding protein n=1 Tax=Ammoniphilus sp. 3BR4 TaxID=3158265 RepID=UPI003465B433